MHIKSMTLDGFKSYGQLTEITGFDRIFNAITGLNGSGKSNILDAICFLLGITNLAQVRAANLQELIYKNGQAGIQKATVSIVFDNRDKSNSPVGYESHNTITITRTIVLGGRNKYLINGCNAQNNRVQDLFGSVQLNVNNPHFLIMQGRITKVLNMKPPEILLMIEEAAGTRMYESKKQSAEKTIEKKDQKLREIENILSEDIGPLLDKLKHERQSYMEYTKIMRELEHLTKLYTAFQYTEAVKRTDKCHDQREGMKKEIDDSNRFIARLKTEMQELDTKIAELEKQMDEHSGGELEDLMKNHKDVQMTETKLLATINNLKENIKGEAKRKNELEKNIKTEEAAVAVKNKELEALLAVCQDDIAKGKADSEALEAAQKLFQALSTGLSSNVDGQAATLADQLMTAKSEIAEAETLYQQSEMKLKHAKKEIKNKREQSKTTETAYTKDKGKYDTLVKDLNGLKSRLDKVGYNEEQLDNLISLKQQAGRELAARRDEYDVAESRVPNMSFQYQNPYHNFDRRKVHGFIAKLIKLKKPETALALEVAAGGRLYNVVVDDEVVGKDLIQRGQLRQRQTMIPLNKITSHVIDSRKVSAAQRLVGADNVWLGLSLVEYDEVLAPAMKHAFGGTLICRTSEHAKKVAFHPQVECRCVTLEGDVYEPSGMLTGGSRQKDRSVLLQVSQLKELEIALNSQKNEIQTIESQINDIRKRKNNYDAMKTDFDAKEGEVETIRIRMHATTHHTLLEEVKELEAVVKDQEETFQKTRETKVKMLDKVKELELKLKDAKGYRERDLKKAEQDLDRCKKEFESSKKQAQEKECLVDSLKMEIGDLMKSVTTDKSQIEEVVQHIAALNAEIEERNDNLKVLQLKVAEASDLVKSKRAEIQAENREIENYRKAKSTKEDGVDSRELKIKELEQEIEKFKKEGKDAEQKLQYLIDSNDWIEQEKQYFGVPNTEYDFQATDPKEAGRKIKKLQENKDKLEKNVNLRAQNLMSKTEQDYNELLRKKQVVLADKSKIEATIKELDEQKKVALVKAYEKVNKDFGSIFSLLLPNAQVKLIPIEGKTVLDGLEVKVGFNNVWKDSLNELSGGQRSLVALSLILAMLLFKPAPIYILDEVDAALDLSHTQNIGQMLRTHFKSSQFIIVSLKDGMFNNANVLFRTKFVNGNSTVARSVNTAPSSG